MNRVSRIFINHRHEDTGGEALALGDRLVGHFGPEKVFLDWKSLVPGMRWFDEVKAHLDTSGVVLVLIGPRWLQILKEREPRHQVDYVRAEVERALERGSGVEVLPVLVDGAIAPAREQLPRALWRLAEIQAEQLRFPIFDDDVDRLIEAIEAIARTRVPRTPEPPPPDPPPPPRTSIVPAPDDRHYAAVVRHIERGTVVPLLGTRINPSVSGGFRVPSLDDEELAEYIASEHGIKPPPADLAGIAQSIQTGSGRPDLDQTLTDVLEKSGEPGRVHRFLAGFPALLDDCKLERRYQLIVTTAFDMALEQAFADANEPYDLVMYMASGTAKGHFVHFPYERGPKTIRDPNKYAKLPVGEDGYLGRTVIVRIHGAVDGGLGRYKWTGNYVVTEDQYIDYLSRKSLPVQILAKLHESHCLFLGYPMRDWNFRVFLKRVWQGERLAANSWAVERDAEAIDQKFWSPFNVECHRCEIDEYVSELEARLRRGDEPPELAA